MLFTAYPPRWGVGFIGRREENWREEIGGRNKAGRNWREEQGGKKMAGRTRREKLGGKILAMTISAENGGTICWRNIQAIGDSSSQKNNFFALIGCVAADQTNRQRNYAVSALIMH
jgi:hypothetical protein